MAVYYYHAIDHRGYKHRGVVEAQGEKEAKAKLRDRGLMVTSLSSTVKTSSKERVDRDTLLTITSQLAQLVNAGVPLYQSLITIEEQFHTAPFHRILLSLCDQIKGGSSLSEAMRSYPDSFDTLYTSMIAAGEASGSLGLILERLSELMKKQNKLRKEISTALIYPTVLASFSLLIIGILMIFVVPSIEGIFAGQKLNAFTTAILGLSHFFREKWWIYLPTLGVLSLFLYFHLRSEKGKLQLQRLMLKTPLVKTLVIQAAVARFARTMGTLQQGGVTILDSLKMSRNVMGNAVLEKEMKEAEQKIMEGSSLSAQLKRSSHIPLIVSQMIAIGEETGNAATMFNNIADMYEESLERTLSRLVALAQPVILIVMGGIIGMVMMAILLPITNISSFSNPK